MGDRERSLENFDGESDAGFRLRIPLMANASRLGEAQFEGQSAMFC